MNVWPTIRDYWTRHRAESLAAFRIVLGLIILGSLLTGSFRTLRRTCGEDALLPIECNDDTLRRAGRLSLLRGPDGMPILGEWLPEDWVKREDGERTFAGRWLENRFPPEGKQAWSDWGARPSSHYLLAGVYLLALVGLIVGFRPRAMAFALVLLSATFHHRLWELMNGGDSLFRNGLYLLVLAPTGLTWSVDRWLLTRPSARGPFALGVVGLAASVLALGLLAFFGRDAVPLSLIDSYVVAGLAGAVSLLLILSALEFHTTRLARRSSGQPPPSLGEAVFVPWWWVAWVWLMQLQICIMYAFTGMVKLDSDYLDGTALYWVFNDLELTRWPYARVPVPMSVCKVMTWTTLAFEAGFVVLIWLGPRPRWLLTFGYVLHVGVYVGLKLSLGLEFGVRDAYLALAAVALVGLLAYLKAVTGKWSGTVEAGTKAEWLRWGLLVGAGLNVGLLAYQACSTLLVPDRVAGILFVVSLLAWSGPSWRWVLLAGVGLHLGILVSMEIGWFSQVALSFYVLFVPGETLAEAWAKAAAWLKGTPRLAAPLEATAA